MDGLKCKEILLSKTYLSTDYFRLEAEYYNAASVSYAQLIKGKDVEEKIQYGTSCYCDEIQSEYPILRLNELHNGFITTPQKYCHIISLEDFEQLKLKKNDVLIVRTNGNPNLVGKAAIVMEDAECAFASYLYRVITNDKINSTTLVSYLNSKYGRFEIDKNSVKGNQTNFSPAKFRDISIPVFPSAMQKGIQALFAKAYQLRQTSNAIYSNAEEALMDCLEMSDCKSVNTSVSTKLLSESYGFSGRLDSEYYQPKYDELFATLKKQTTKFLGGKDGIVSIKKSIEPGSDAYGEEGIPFVRVSDITKFGISAPSIMLSNNVVEDVTTLYPQRDTILFSKDGSVGIAYKVEKDLEVITSGALLHLTVKKPEEVLPDYLTLVLNSPVVQLQAERDSNGAIIQHWKPSEIEKVIIPVIDIDIQKQIAAKVKESFFLRHQSERLLENAKQAVEIAIEQSEDKAMEWLKEKGVEC